MGRVSGRIISLVLFATSSLHNTKSYTMLHKEIQYSLGRCKLRYFSLDPPWEKFKLTRQHNKSSSTMVETVSREKSKISFTIQGTSITRI